MKVSSILSLLIVGLVSAQNLETLKGHKLFRCPVTDVASIEKLDINHDVQRINSDKKYAVVRTRNEVQEKSLDSECKVIKKDLSVASNKVNSRMASPSIDLENVDPFFADYQSYDSIKSRLQGYAEKYKNLVEFIPSIGKTVEGRDIYALKISRKACTKDKKSIWFNGGIHAREWIAPATVLYNIDTLLKNYNTDKEVRNIFNKFDLYFTPVSNPDGYEYTRAPDGDRLWRKNRRQNSDGVYGVDLNRNFGERWGTIGVSNSTDSETYPGTGPFSEPESQALEKFGLSLPHGYAGIDFHSYGQLILRSWGFKVESPATNEKYLKELGDGMQAVYKTLGYEFTSELSAGLYPAGGAVDDWMAAKAKLQAFTLELCSTDDEIGFVLPKEQIIPCASATHQALLFFFKYLSTRFDLPPNEPLP